MDGKLFGRHSCETRDTTSWRMAKSHVICADTYISYSGCGNKTSSLKIVDLNPKMPEKRLDNLESSLFQAIIHQVVALYTGLIPSLLKQ